MKTGEKTDPALKTLLQMIFREEVPSLKKAGSGSSSSTEPAKRMFGKQSPEAKGSQPAKACAKALESKPVKPVKAIRFTALRRVDLGRAQIPKVWFQCQALALSMHQSCQRLRKWKNQL